MKYDFEAAIQKKTINFLKSQGTLGKREWIYTEESSIYVRMGNRYINGNREITFEIASVMLKRELRGKGWFRRYLRMIGIMPIHLTLLY